MKLDKKSLLLYAVTDRSWLNNKTLYNEVEQALKGGATFIQLREKELKYKDFLKEAFEIKKLCQSFHVPFVINDNVEIAKETDADGVHIGQNDMDMERARKILGNNKIIGVSVQTVEQAIKAEKEGASYLGVGSVFSTTSKDDAINVTKDTLKNICENVHIPVIAIGGITNENVYELKDTGICGIAVISAIFAKNDVKKATEELMKNILKTIPN